MENDREKEAYNDAKSALQCYLLSQPLQTLSLRHYFLLLVFNLQAFELHMVTVKAADNAYESFFTRYSLLCKLAANKDREVERITHWQLVETITLLKRHDSIRGDVVITVMQDPAVAHSQSLARTLVDLAAGIWLMLSISMYPGDISYDEPVIWKDYEILGTEQNHSQGLISKNFSHHYNSIDLVKLPQTFTAAHLEQIGGI